MATKELNINQFANFTQNFEKEMSKVGAKTNSALAKSMQRSVRVRATGRLKSIGLKPKGTKIIMVEYPTQEISKIASYVNNGQYPKHPIPALLMEASRAGRETAGRKSKDVLGTLTPDEISEGGGFVQPRPSQTKGFFSKAFDSTRRNSAKIIEKALQEAWNAA